MDGVAGFDYGEGSWRITGAALPEALGWVLREQVLFHEILPRYRRIRLGTGTARRGAVWTSPRSIEAEDRHERMRQRQEKWKREQAEPERQATLLRAHEEALAEDAQRAEAERVRKIREAQEAARLAALRRQWALEDEARQRRREAEKVARQEREEAVRQQEHAEHQAATRWWQELSAAQREELFTAVRDRLQGAEPGPTWRRTGSRPELDEQPTRGHAYGVAVRLKTRRGYEELYAVIRPSPASAHRLPDEVSVFVRNAREARQLTDTGAITAERVIAFDLPDGEQLSLL